MLPICLTCEIVAPTALGPALAEIATTLAQDVGQPIAVAPVVISPATIAPCVTLHLPAELASAQRQVWCLAGQLACFCPDARVSVLVQAAGAISAPPKTASRSAATAAA